MTMQEQNLTERQRLRANFFRYLVFYPAIWIAVSVALFYLVKIN